ncbi:MAG: hypothetical protein ACTSW1_14010 [Candidatus Hodarchaeales archaeon]
MTTTQRLDDNTKAELKRLQARLRLMSGIKIDQTSLLREVIYFGAQNFEEFLSFLQGVHLTKEEIDKTNNQYIKSYSYHYPEKTDDELLYGEND